jgi:hypothetical protein
MARTAVPVATRELDCGTMSTDGNPNRYMLAIVFYLAGALVAFGACLWAHHMKEVFDNMSVELPWLTDLVMNLAEFAATQWYILLPFFGLSTVPAFVWKNRAMKTYLWIGGAFLVFSLVLVPLAVFVPVHKLQVQLQQK